MSLLYLPYSVSVPTPVVSIPTTPFIHSFFLSALSATGAAGRADHVSSRAPIDNASTNRPDRVADRRGGSKLVSGLSEINQFIYFLWYGVVGATEIHHTL